MNLENFLKQDLSSYGKEMHRFMQTLYPICRSLTGNGVRKTHELIREKIPLKTKEIPSNTQVFDWTVPKEWNINDAYVKDSAGNRIIDFQKSNLHVLNYSVPVNKKVSLPELKKHLYTLPDQPDLIPYLTSYYKENWGFCLSHNEFLKLKDEEYEVVIDSSLTNGSLTISELLIEGKSKEEVLLSCYTCHPSLCNDNLSGVVLCTELAKTLKQCDLNYSYRILFIPETIGAITWLALNETTVKNIKHGLVASCVAGPGPFGYKKSRRGNAKIDLAAQHILKHSDYEYRVQDFYPLGSDERQFCSPGFDLPVGRLIKTPSGEILCPEYHTSADNLEFVTADNLAKTFEMYLKTIFVLENDRTFLSTNPKGEPQLGKRGLYNMVGGQKREDLDILTLLWIMNLADGQHSLLDMAIRTDIGFEKIKRGADILLEAGLIKV